MDDPIQKVSMLAKEFLLTWKKERQGHAPDLQARWQTLECEWIKLNCDLPFMKGKDYARVVGFLRNSQGDFLSSFIKKSGADPHFKMKFLQ